MTLKETLRDFINNKLTVIQLLSEDCEESEKIKEQIKKISDFLYNLED